MVTKTFIGGAETAIEEAESFITAVDATPANNTFRVTMGNVFVEVPGNTDIATTTSDLTLALFNEQHPYFQEVIWIGSSSRVAYNSKVAGVRHEPVLSVHGVGSGTVTDFAIVDPSSGPNDADIAENYSDGVLPVAGDQVFFDERSPDLLWGLAGLEGVTLSKLVQLKTHTSRIGLSRAAFVTSADGLSTNADYPEYRQPYFRIGWDDAEIGLQLGPGRPGSSPRLKLHNTKASGGSSTRVYDTHRSGEANSPAVQLLFDDAGADLIVDRMPGGLGIAIDDAGEVATMGQITITTDLQSDRLFVGKRVTLAGFDQSGGDNLLQLEVADPAAVTCRGGDLVIEGERKIGTLEVTGGTCIANNVDAGDVLADLALLSGGLLDLLQTPTPRQIANLTMAGGGEVRYRSDVVTFGTITTPTGERRIRVD